MSISAGQLIAFLQATVKVVPYAQELIAALTELEELQNEVAALRAMRDDYVQHISALEEEVETIRTQLHECYDVLENRR